MPHDNLELLEQFMNNSEIIYPNQYKKLFSHQDNIEEIMEYLSPANEEWRTEKKEKKKYLKEFTYKLSTVGLQIPFLQAVITYINNRLFREHPFENYEHVIHYSCIAAAGLKNLEGLEEDEREDFFENLLTGIRYAGERRYNYKGKEEITRYAFLVTKELVKEIAERNFVLDADSIKKRTYNDNMVYFVDNSCMAKKEKEKYRKIDELLVKKCYTSLGLLADSLEQVFEEYILSAFTEFEWDVPLAFTDKDAEDWQQIFELSAVYSSEKVRVCGKLDVWKCSIQYLIIHDFESRVFWRSGQQMLKLEYGIDLKSNTEVWKEIVKSEILYSKPDDILQSVDVNKQMQDVLKKYLAEWAQRSISGSVLEKRLEVLCFWHDEIRGRNVEENIIRVKGCPCVTHEKVNCRHIFKIDLPEEEVVPNQYRINHADFGAIKSINILLGRNGSGKTSTMMILSYDGPEANAKEISTKFFIVYKRGEDYFYSTNLREEEYDLNGDVLQKGEQNISDYRGQKNKVVYYSNVLHPYMEKPEFMATNTIDLSSQYIRDMEIGRLAPNDMIYTNKIYGEERESRLEHKQDYNQENLRQLQFLYDTEGGKESWMPDYVKKFVYVRCALDDNSTEDKIYRYITDNRFENKLTGFWEYQEWTVYYHDKKELKKIIDFCKKIIEDEEVLYFEIRLPQMSSGEMARFTLFSRLHAWISQMTFLDYRQNNVLLLDELEAYMHPEWQRCLIYDLISFFEWEHSIGHPVKVQLFISSNSPFLISDVDMDEITVMSKDIEVEEKTFAQNIHVILKDSFFKKSGSMGEYARQRVDRVYKILAGYLQKKENQEFELNRQEAVECSRIIRKIGEPLLYKDLQEMYDEVFGEEETNAEFENQIREMPDEELTQWMKAVQNELKRRRS